jgi:N-6 DNA Methylase
MRKRHKDLLRTLVRELRHKLLGITSPIDGQIVRGNLDRELERLGIAPDGTIKPIDTLIHIQSHEQYAHRVAAAQLSPLPMSQRSAIRSEIVEQAAYTWINRLFALRAMEVRGLIDNTLRGDEAYGGIPEKLFLVRDTQPERATGADGGWWAVVEDACNDQAQSLPGLFLLNDPTAALRPSEGVLLQCVTLISGELPGFTVEESDGAFQDPDAIGWAYQFYQEESKALIYAKLGNGGKVASRAETAAATQLFTEPYIVQWLLQNSLGHSYHEINPQSTLPQIWPYYVKPEKLDTSTHFTLETLTLLDPCVGSGHFLRVAFDIFVTIYHEQFPAWNAHEIANRILSDHLYGIDLDPRAAQLTALTLYLRAWELVHDERQQQYLPGGTYRPPPMNIATTPTNLNKGALERHLQRHPQDRLFEPLIKEVFAGLEQAELLGSLLRPREYLEKAITDLQHQHGVQRSLFDPDTDELSLEIAALAKSDPVGLKQMALERVAASFKSEAGNVDDVSAMLFGREAEQGVHLMQLLDQQYAVVVTNPPYMGSRHMDLSLKKYVEKYYTPGKRDVYAAFILRCLELCKSKGKVAMVTMQNWMFLRSFAELRAVSQEQLATYTRERKFTGLLRETSIDILAHLGSNSFEEIGGEVVQSVMFAVSNKVPNEDHMMIAFRLVGIKTLVEKIISLVNQNDIDGKQIIITSKQFDLLAIPESPIVYFLSKKLLSFLSQDKRLKDIANVRQGLATADNARFTRCFWEASKSSNRWVSYAKGGGYCKWIGLEWLFIDWQLDGSRLKAFPRSVLRSPEYYFQSGLTYSLMTSGSLATRIMEQSIFDVTGTSIFPLNSIPLTAIATLTVSRVASYLLRVTTQDLKFNAGYVSNLPLSMHFQQDLAEIVGNLCTAIKEVLITQNPIEQRFDRILKREDYKSQAILHTIEGWNEYLIKNAYELDEKSIQVILEETGIPASWYPLINYYDTLPTFKEGDLLLFPQELFDYLTQHERITLDTKELTRIKANLQALYEAGPGAKNVEQEEATNVDEEGEEEIASGAHIPIPTETFLEELSVKMQIHPISVYWLLEELRAEGVRCLPEERRILEDRLSVLILRLLGHRWPKQIEAGEPVPTWAVRNGIIPLINNTGKRTLAEQLRERLRAEDGDIGAQQTEALLEELTGQSLEEWLRRRFFPRHVSQFKGRPVAWHLASMPGKTTNGKGKKSRGGGIQRKPAFECILYYHACTTNALARIRNEYVEPLILAERGKIAQGKSEPEEGQLFNAQSVPDDTASAAASERIRELNAFAHRLRTIEEEGFRCDELQKVLVDEPLDRWSGDGYLGPRTPEELLRLEGSWHVDINDGVRVNIAPLQLADVLANDVLKAADARNALKDRARWRSDERRWVREGKLPRCGWMDERIPADPAWDKLEPQRLAEQQKLEQKRLLLQQGKQVDDVYDAQI